MSLAASKVPILEIEFHGILLELGPIPARSCLNIMQMAATPNWIFSRSSNAGNTLCLSLAVKNAWINCIDLRIFKKQLWRQSSATRLPITYPPSVWAEGRRESPCQTNTSTSSCNKERTLLSTRFILDSSPNFAEAHFGNWEQPKYVWKFQVSEKQYIFNHVSLLVLAPLAKDSHAGWGVH